MRSSLRKISRTCSRWVSPWLGLLVFGMASPQHPTPDAMTMSGALTPTAAAVTTGTAQKETTSIRLLDVASDRGIDFVHTAGKSAARHLPETMGSGVAWIDYDNDGGWDLYFVDSGILAGTTPLIAPIASAGTNRLYRASPTGIYEDARRAGLGDRGYGMGVAAADYDGDGWSDVYVTNFGADVLFRNNGDGSFTNVSDEVGVGDERWGSSAAWGDLDGDGFPDLYLSNYLVYATDTARACTDTELGIRIYCPPQMFDGVEDALYRNVNGNRMDQITQTAGVANAREGKGLAVTITDIDGDGRDDIYVANDATRNFLYINRGGLEFNDDGLFSGTGFGRAGQPQSGMGIDVGDLDGDGIAEIGVTNFHRQPVNLYQTRGDGIYADETFTMGIGPATMPTLGFGIVFLDIDSDSDLEVAVANGHVLDHLDDYAQPNQLFLNLSAEQRGGAAAPQQLFRDITDAVGDDLGALAVSRGLAYGDGDGDGRPDLVVTNSDAAPQLLHNATSNANGRLVVRLRGRTANRGGLGARVIVTTQAGTGEAAATQRFDVKAGTSYLSQSVTDLYVGLGAAASASIQVRWPDGSTESIDYLAAGQLVLVRQGSGLVATRPLVAGR